MAVIEFHPQIIAKIRTVLPTTIEVLEFAYDRKNWQDAVRDCKDSVEQWTIAIERLHAFIYGVEMGQQNSL